LEQSICAPSAGKHHDDKRERRSHYESSTILTRREIARRRQPCGQMWWPSWCRSPSSTAIERYGRCVRSKCHDICWRAVLMQHRVAQCDRKGMSVWKACIWVGRERPQHNVVECWPDQGIVHRWRLKRPSKHQRRHLVGGGGGIRRPTC